MQKTSLGQQTSFKSAAKPLGKVQYYQKSNLPHIAPKVEYFLTQKGESLLPLVEMMEKWGNDFMDDFFSVQEKTQQKIMNTYAAV